MPGQQHKHGIWFTDLCQYEIYYDVCHDNIVLANVTNIKCPTT